MTKQIDTKVFNTEPKIRYDKYIFREIPEDAYNENNINSLKSKIKNNQKIYRFAIELFSPVLTFYSNRYLKKFIREHYTDESQTFLNLGSGNSVIDERVVNVDFFPYKNVDIVCDIENLPFKDNSIDLIANIAVLEHVPNPERVVQEIYRVLKPNGKVYSVMPFMQGFHASPYDFSRRTYEGIKVLYKDFEIKEVKCIGGPTSGMLWILQDWLAIILSFGSKKLHSILYILMMLLTFPVKFLDFIFIHHPMAKNISSAFLVLAEKK